MTTEAICVYNTLGLCSAGNLICHASCVIIPFTIREEKIMIFLRHHSLLILCSIYSHTLAHSLVLKNQLLARVSHLMRCPIHPFFDV